MFSIEHIYSPEQYARAAELWQRLIDHPSTSMTEDRGYSWPLQKIADEHLHALILSDGDDTEDDYPVTLSLIEYSDYSGTTYDVANVRSLDGTPGVNVRANGVHGAGSAWIQLGELPTNGEDIDTGLGWLAALADTMDGLTDYPLINDEEHSNYETELADDAWDAWLHSDVMDALDKMAPDEDSEPSYCATAEQEVAIREAYYSYEENEWNTESATSIVNGRHEDAVRHVAATVFGWAD